MRDRKEIKTGGREGQIRLFVTMLLGLSLVISPSVALPSPGGEGGKLPSENTALWISLLGTALPLGYVLLKRGSQSVYDDHAVGDWAGFLGTLIGPSLGFIYGGCWARGLATVGLRAAVVVGAGLIMLSNDEADNTVPALAALGLYAGSVIFDLATVKKAVRRRNATVRARNGLDVSVAPFVMARAKGAGIRLELNF